MEILPPQTQLSITPIKRRHNPTPATGEKGYQQYRPCLRWDFSFSCALCLLHEVDFVLLGIKGLPIFTSEHLQLQSKCKSKINDYENVINCCSWCNNARRSSPVINNEGHRLLDPTKDAWGNHFAIQEDKIIPLLHDNDASYTKKVYGLNDERKVRLREERRKAISNSILWIEQWLGLIQELTVWAQQYPDERSTLLLRATQLRHAVYETFLKLKNYTPIPHDAPSKCRCETTEMHCLHEDFRCQLIAINT